jgi:pimeloyl-ACP methyl ester carboxylesterase
MARPDAETDAAAQALIDDVFRPRRRARPRLAEALHDARYGEIDGQDGALSVWRVGEGPATLLVHGWEDDNALWGPLMERLLRYGRAVVAVDLPGHGFSSAPMAGATPSGALLAHAAERFGPVDSAVGHSFGCAVVMAALHAGMPAARVILIAPPQPGSADGRLRREGAFAPPEVLKRALELMRRTHSMFATLDLVGLAREMTAEALIIHSLDDEQSHPSISFDLAAAWPGAKTHIVDGLGHRLVAQDAETLEVAALFVEGGGSEL